MATTRRYWVGSVGPLYYDEDSDVPDPTAAVSEKQGGIVTEGRMAAMLAPVNDNDVLRNVDTGTLTGDVYGPGSSTDNAVVRFDGTDGKTLQNSVMIVDDSGNVYIPGKVGIGTDSPSENFVVSNGGAEGLEIDPDSTNDRVYLTWYDRDLSVYTDAFLRASEYDFSIGSASKVKIDTSGNVGIGTTSPSEALDVNSDAIRIRTSQTPATAGAAGTAGMICWDSDYIYVCVATDTWKRAALSTW
jgi:hypothetical protein